MDRWTTVAFLESCGLTLYEQAIFVSYELPVYNSLGCRVIEKKENQDLECGCVYLSGGIGFDGTGTLQYYTWISAPGKLRGLKYKTSELVEFVNKHKSKPKFYDIVSCLPASLLDYIDYKKEFEDAQLRIKELERTVGMLTESSDNNIANQTSRNSAAVASRQAKATQNWQLTVEKAVALAVDCARKNKAMSTKQHRELWRKSWNVQDNSTPRKEGFEAFRRGLPEDLKKIQTKVQ